VVGIAPVYSNFDDPVPVYGSILADMSKSAVKASMENDRLALPSRELSSLRRQKKAVTLEQFEPNA
jgi:hypothetical protein